MLLNHEKQLSLTIYPDRLAAIECSGVSLFWKQTIFDCACGSGFNDFSETQIFFYTGKNTRAYKSVSCYY